jgi:hypothetical protein
VRIVIPESVTSIEEASFEGCAELETCIISRDSSLVTIGDRAFAKCISLRSFDIPRLVVAIGSNCFDECIHLYQLRCLSSESLKRIVGDRSLYDALDELGVSGGSGLFRIEVEDGGAELKVGGWDCVSLRSQE